MSPLGTPLSPPNSSFHSAYRYISVPECCCLFCRLRPCDPFPQMRSRTFGGPPIYLIYETVSGTPDGHKSDANDDANGGMDGKELDGTQLWCASSTTSHRRSDQDSRPLECVLRVTTRWQLQSSFSHHPKFELIRLSGIKMWCPVVVPARATVLLCSNINVTREGMSSM